MLTTKEPAVIALYEVEGKTVFSSLSEALPGYQWHITEGRGREWVDSSNDNESKHWVEEHSNHSYLIFEVQNA